MATDRDRYLMRKYGIDEADYQLLLAAYGGGCWICGREPTARRLHVDHDHKTGRIRGLLCWRCNRGLQHFRDDAAIMSAASKYVSSDEAQEILDAHIT